MKQKVKTLLAFSITYIFSVLILRVVNPEISNVISFFPALFIALTTIYFDIKKGKDDISLALHGEHDPTEYINRDEESKIINLLQKEEKRIIYVKGNSGIGKTLFLHKIMNDINAEKRCKNFKAFYFYVNENENIEKALYSQIGMSSHSNSNIDTFIERLKIFSKRNKIVLLIDDCQTLQVSMNEFILKLKNRNVSIYFIIASKQIDNMKNSIELHEFGRNDIINLAKKINVELLQNDAKKIMDVSNGLPVFVVFLIKEVLNNQKSISLTNSNSIKEYIKIRAERLNESTFDCLLYIAYHALLEQKLAIKDAKNSRASITTYNLNVLVKHSFIVLDENYIKIDRSIALILREGFESLRYDYYQILYDIYVDIDIKKASLFLLLSNEAICEEEISKVITSLHKLLIEKDFQYIVYLFKNTYCSEKLNFKLSKNEEFLQYFKYCYLQSLTELGEYAEALFFIESSKFDDTIFNETLQISFDVDYLICDLYHLTCEYRLALENLEILKNKYSNDSYQNKLLWLEGHIKRHQGQLNRALSKFQVLIANKDSIEESKVIVKSMYAIISIRNFYARDKAEYEDEFYELNHFLEERNCKDSYNTSINRHKAVYYKRIKKDYNTALRLLTETIDFLENNPERILYDYYFEIAEVYRVLSEGMDNNYKLAKQYYNKAIEFSNAMNDKNLLENCLLGAFLLSLKSKDVNLNKIDEIKELNKLFDKERYINYANFMLIKNIILEQNNSSLMKFFEQEKWNYHYEFLRDNMNVVDFELSVM